MKTISIVLGLAALLSFTEAKGEYRYRLQLDGKPGSEVYPLSERAIERRARLGIETDSLDYEVSPQYISQLQAAGLKILARSRWLNTVVVMKENGHRVVDSVWQAMPFIKEIKTLTIYQHSDYNPYRLVSPKNLKAGENCGTPLEEVNAMEPLFNAGYRGNGVLVCVLDAGFTNVDNWSWLYDRVVGYQDMYEKGNGVNQVFTGDTHGAHCLSIMASPQSHGVWGTAQEASYYLVRTETSNSETSFEEDQWVAGAEIADSIGADIISSSLGYTEFDGSLCNHKYNEFCQNKAQCSRGAAVACQKGIVVFNAAGNEGNDDWVYISFPADAKDVMTIGGTNPDGSSAYFTSRGFLTPYVKPDVSARATSCYTVGTNGSASYGGAGTSYATPLVAGCAASLWSAVPELTPEELRQCIRQSAINYADPDSILGYGRADFGAALQLARELHPQGIEAIQNDSHSGIVYDLQGCPMKASDANLRRSTFMIIDGKKVIIRD